MPLLPLYGSEDYFNIAMDNRLENQINFVTLNDKQIASSVALRLSKIITPTVGKMEQGTTV